VTCEDLPELLEPSLYIEHHAPLAQAFALATPRIA
jgi:hypothetical protein